MVGTQPGPARRDFDAGFDREGVPNGVIELKRFFEAADGRGSYWTRQQKLFAKQKDDAAKREQIEERTEADVAAFWTGAAMASEAQIRAFSVKLDIYETATVEALIANDRAMEAVQAKIADMLARAYVLEDGRRVFKTEDGTQVFDEFGEEVGTDHIAPGDIDDSFPTWEQYSAEREIERALAEERTQIIEFQERLDEAREEISGGDITEADLEKLDAELADLMPPAVANQMPEADQEVAPSPQPTVASVKISPTLDF